MNLLRRSLFCVVTCTTLFFGSSVYALSNTVAPAFVKLSVSTQDPLQTASISITNNNEETLTYNISITDVDVSTGSLLPKDTAGDTTKQLLTLQQESITIAGKKSAAISITAKNNDMVSPGGHYAAIKIEPVIADLKNSGSNLQQMFSVPVFVTKQDGALYTLQANIQGGGGVHIGSLPNIEVNLKNTGNVDGVVRGFASFIRGTKTYSRQNFNETSVPLFAGQQQNFTATPKPKSPNFVGRYSMVVSYRLDGQDQPIIHTVVGWYIPWWCVGLAVVLAAIIYLVASSRKSRKKLNIPKAMSSRQIIPIKPVTRRSRASIINSKSYQPNKKQKVKVVSEFGSTKGIK